MCFDYPTQAKNIKIGCNRLRGRPRLTAAALEYQYNEYVEECIYSDTDSDSEKPAKKTATKRKKVATPESDSDYDIFEETNKVVVASTSAAKSSITVTKAAAKQVTKAVVKTVTKAKLEQTARVTKRLSHFKSFFFKFSL